MTSEAPKEEWPLTLSLSSFHRDEIVNYMQEDMGFDDAGDYTLTTHAQAMVAAERNALVKEIHHRAQNYYTQRESQSAVKTFGDAVLAWAEEGDFTTAEERAALDALLKAQRVKALREAADACVNLRSGSSVGYNEGWNDGLDIAEQNILALIEKETGHE